MSVKQTTEAPRLNRLLWSPAVSYSAAALATLTSLFVLDCAVQIIPMTQHGRTVAWTTVVVLFGGYMLLSIFSGNSVKLSEGQKGIPVDCCLYGDMEDYARSTIKVDERFKASLNARILRISPLHWISIASRAVVTVGGTAAALVAWPILTFVLKQLFVAQSPGDTEEPVLIQPPPGLPSLSSPDMHSGWTGLWWAPWLIVCLGYLTLYFQYVGWKCFVYIVSDRRAQIVRRYKGALWWRTIRPNTMPVTKPDIIDYYKSWLGSRRFINSGYLILDAPTTGDTVFHSIGPLPDVENAHADTLMAAEALYGQRD